jgi:pimeloyl-ACP methyl ester carboxylesterase
MQKDELNIISIRNNFMDCPSDSITMVVSGDMAGKKPAIVFIQGSGNLSLFKYGCWGCMFSCMSHYMYNNRDYHFVLISKPGVSLCTPDSIQQGTTDETYVSKDFWPCDTKNYYVESTSEVLRYLRRQPYIDTSQIYLVGHSQGARVVAKIASSYPNLITKVVFMSANIFGRSVENIIALYANAIKGEIGHQELIEKMVKIYETEKWLKQNGIKWEPKPERMRDWQQKDWDNYTAVNNYSFNGDPSIWDLTNIQVPLLVVYGTSDYKSIDCSLLPLLLLNTDVNYTIRPYPSYEHNYFMVDSAGKAIMSEWHWNDVFDDVIRWIEEK